MRWVCGEPSCGVSGSRDELKKHNREAHPDCWDKRVCEHMVDAATKKAMHEMALSRAADELCAQVDLFVANYPNPFDRECDDMELAASKYRSLRSTADTREGKQEGE